jgi:hypothetical protein
MLDDPTTISRLRRLLGKTGLLDSRKIALVKALQEEIPDVPGEIFYGWVTMRAGALVKDRRERIVVKLTDHALRSLKTAVETVGHELHHIREALAGAGASEKAAESAALAYLRRFVEGLRRLE